MARCSAVSLAVKVNGLVLSTSVRSTGAVAFDSLPSGSRKLSVLAPLFSVSVLPSTLAFSAAPFSERVKVMPGSVMCMFCHPVGEQRTVSSLPVSRLYKTALGGVLARHHGIVRMRRSAETRAQADRPVRAAVGVGQSRRLLPIIGHGDDLAAPA